MQECREIASCTPHVRCARVRHRRDVTAHDERVGRLDLVLFVGTKHRAKKLGGVETVPCFEGTRRAFLKQSSVSWPIAKAALSSNSNIALCQYVC